MRNKDSVIAELKTRLSEVEDALRAIRGGEVDAFVMDGKAGKQVYTLRGAEEPYRILVERMHERAITLASDGTVLYGNTALSLLLGRPLPEIVGSSAFDHIATASRGALQSILIEPLATGRRREVVFRCADGSHCPALIATALIPAEGIQAVTAIVTDLREQRRMMELSAAERFARAVVEQATEAVIVCDASGYVVQMSNAAERLLRDARGMHYSDVFHQAIDSLIDENTPATLASDIVRAALNGKSVRNVEVTAINKQADMRYFLLSAGPLLNSLEKPAGCIVTLTNISDRKAAETRQHLLMDELNHRVKNTLAAVQSIASHTGRSAPDIEAFRNDFGGRLLPLARAHDLLTQQAWQGAMLRDVLRGALAPYLIGTRDRIQIVDGPRIQLTPNAAVTLGMGVHELATNAAKYGALSTDTGKVTLVWNLRRLAEGELIEIVWCESDGPPVQTPLRRGFGSRLIERGIAGEFGGRVEMDYRPEGFCCTARLPLSEKAYL